MATVVSGTQSRSSTMRKVNATRVIATTVGVILGLSGVNHGLFEVLQGDVPTNGPVIQAIGEAQRFWPLGTEEAFTMLPTFLMAGLVSMVLGLAIVVWSLRYLQTERGPAVFLGLFVLLFLAGGGIGQVVFFLPAWAFARHMDRPPAWWARALGPRIRPALARVWPVALGVSSLLLLAGIEVAILGFFPGVTEPAALQNLGMGLVLASALLYLGALIAGYAHELERLDSAR